MSACLFREGGCSWGLAFFKTLSGGASRQAKSTFALSALLAAAFACESGALPTAWAQEAAKAGRGPAALSPSHEDAAGDGTALMFVQARDRFTVKDLVGYEGRPVAVAIEMPTFASTDYVLLSFRGLPEDFALSSGFRTADTWLVSAHELINLTLIPPEGFVGSFRLEVLLIRGQSVPPLVQNVRVELRSGARAEQNAAAPTAASAPVNRIAPDKEKQLVETAAGLLQQNDIAAARLIYARLAREGSVQGALAMAQTYDPVSLSKYNVTGLQPDKEKARYWYGMATRLGSEDAPKRLLALEAAEPQ